MLYWHQKEFVKTFGELRERRICGASGKEFKEAENQLPIYNKQFYFLPPYLESLSRKFLPMW